MNASLRQPLASDYAAIASWVPNEAAARRWAGPRLSFPFSAQELPALLAVPGGGKVSYTLSDETGIPFGFGQHWVLQPGAVHLGRIIVGPEFRGRGLGRELCVQLISAALQATTATAVTLRAYKDNLAAVALYTSLGFAELASESTHDAFFMRMLANQSAQRRRHVAALGLRR